VADRPLAPLLMRGIREATSMVLVAILLFLDLPALVASQHLYPAPWVGWLCWGLLAAVAAADLAIGVPGRFWGRAAWPAAVFVLGVSTATSAALPPEHLLTPADWTFGVVGWFGPLLFADRRLRHAALFIVVHVASTAALLAVSGRLLDDLVPLLLLALGVSSFQVAVLVATLVLRTMADAATEVLAAQADAVTRDSVAREVHADREARYAALRDTALPLLRGIADGALSPSEHSVQRRAAVEAARLRRLFSEHTDRATPLAAEVEALVEVVERRGVRVRYAARPLVVEPPPEVRRSLVEAVSGVLLVTARTARVTVGGTGSDVTVSVVTDGDVGGAGDDGPGGGVRRSTVVDGGRTWVEATWTIP
jgi:hypothetical protein